MPKSSATKSAHAQTTRDPAEQVKLDQAITDLYEQKITFNQSLGLHVVSLDLAHPVLRFAMKPELIGHFAYGRLHGGVISTALDVVGSFALMLGIADRHRDESADQVMHRFMRMGTIDLRIDFLRQGIGHHFDATASITRLGGRIGSTQMRLTNEAGDLIATGSAAYIVA